MKGTCLKRCKSTCSKKSTEENQKLMQVLKDNLTMAQNHMKQQAYLHRTKREFEVQIGYL